MTDSNRVRIATVREASLGVTPNSPRLRTARITGASLSYKPSFVTPTEIRADRMNADPVKVNETVDGSINYELSYPVQDTPLADFIQSMMFSSWANKPVRDNDGVADSVISQVTAATGAVTVNAGSNFAVGHLVRMTGFGVAANNGTFRITTAGSTAPAVGAALLADEPVPPATARMKVVGFQGVAGDLVAVADGITSTALDFTTLGLSVGEPIKIGGSSVGNRFASNANNGFARIIAITASKLTLDNLPAGWAADTGAAKTIRCFTGDVIRNGVSLTSLTIEQGFLGQAVPTFITQRGMVVSQAEISGEAEQILKGSFSFMGLSGGQSQVALSASPDAATTVRNMAASTDVARISENGVSVASPNFVRASTLSINNNLRLKTAEGALGAVDIGVGEFSLEVKMTTYFGDNTLYAKLLAGTVTNFNKIITKDSQALIISVPRLTFSSGSPSVGGKNQDITVDFSATSSIDPLTGAELIITRIEYFEL